MAAATPSSPSSATSSTTPSCGSRPRGAAVANFRIASTPRTLDQQTNEWKDGDSAVPALHVWRQAAENVAESLQRGMRVIVQGRLKQRSYETREGEKRTVFEIEVDEVGPSLRYATAKVTKARAAAAAAAAGSAAAAAAPVPTTRGRTAGGRLRRRRPAVDRWLRRAAVLTAAAHRRAESRRQPRRS